jgi:hypothetical protein
MPWSEVLLMDQRVQFIGMRLFFIEEFFSLALQDYTGRKNYN